MVSLFEDFAIEQQSYWNLFLMRSTNKSIAEVQIEISFAFPTLTRSYSRRFTLITRTARCLRQLPSCVAVYPRDPQSHVFYVADPISSIAFVCKS